ncbi:uncharacterized protein K441DRAFT_729322 [Cenococcum geophilum 1.58]|uniref:uncharacterized protein n=1 Tax=Cenococcum geophilum 1.58 TaxID=794803 RepID=UPI00358E9767|nr:hypothetical protein K441DRAFT_729322 [Cenococcum geophilum 1.58]
MDPRPQVGVAVLVLDGNGKVIMGQRQGSHGAGTWAFPGGHLEYGETFDVCAKREVLEETGLPVVGIQFLAATNDFMPSEGKHYVTVFVGCMIEGQNKEPVVSSFMEPNKCSKWEWMPWQDVRKWVKGQTEAEAGKGKWSGEYLFLPIVNLFRQHPDFDPTTVYGES